jgi:hypothetical protein
MGCFSYMCKECDKPVLSTSFAGQDVWLFLLKDGKVVQQMDGEYDSYGRCFIDGTQDPRVTHGLRLSHQWTPVQTEWQPFIKNAGLVTSQLPSPKMTPIKVGVKITNYLQIQAVRK